MIKNKKIQIWSTNPNKRRAVDDRAAGAAETADEARQFIGTLIEPLSFSEGYGLVAMMVASAHPNQ